MKGLTAGLAIAALAPVAHFQMNGAEAAFDTRTAEEIRKADAQAEEEWYFSAGVQNYVFTLPLAMLERERKVRQDPATLEKANKVAAAASIEKAG